jgi:hypothetical protein
MEGAEMLLEHILPQQIIEYFSISKVEKTTEGVTVFLKEKNIPPQGNTESKGFLPAKVMHDFPMRGKPARFLIKRRRWRDKTSGEEVKRDYGLMASGTKLEQEFSAFLKD